MTANIHSSDGSDVADTFYIGWIIRRLTGLRVLTQLCWTSDFCGVYSDSIHVLTAAVIISSKPGL